MTPQTPLIGIAIFIIWIVALYFLLPRIGYKNRYNKAVRYDLYSLLGYEKLKKEAESAGWSLNNKEFIAIVGLSVLVGVFIALLIGNVFFIGVGIVLSFMLPRFIIMKYKRKKRTNILFELPDNLKMVVSKLNDFPSLEKAFEMAQPDYTGECGEYFRKAYEGLKVKLPADKVFEELNRAVRVNKLRDFTDKLLMASLEGFHKKSLDSLKETIKDISYDIKMIKSLELKSKRTYKRLYSVIGMSWAMPIMLSTMNSQNGNVFLNTFYGQLFIVVFFLITIFCIIKGDEYLSLKLEDL